VFKDIASLRIELLAPLGRLRIVAKPIELRTKLGRYVLRKLRDHDPDDVIFPDIVIRAQHVPDVRYERGANGREKGRKDLSDGPVVVLKPLHELTQDWLYSRTARVNYGLRAHKVSFVLRNKITNGI